MGFLENLLCKKKDKNEERKKKVVRTFLIEEDVWNKFKEMSIKKDKKSASIVLREMIKKYIEE